MPFVTVNGIKHHYLQEGHGPDVVLIHGMGGNLSFWHANKALASLKNDFRVTVYDMRSHGYSDFVTSGFTSRDLAGDLAALMDAIGVQKAFVAGHSLGGLVALHAAHLFPAKVAGLMLVEGNIPALRHLINLDEWKYRQQREQMLANIDPNLPDLLKGRDIFYLEYRLKNLKASNSDPDLSQFGLRKGMSLKAKKVLRLLDETTVKTEIREIAGLTEEVIKTVSQPTLALYGQFSPLIPVCNYLHDHLPHCTRVVIPEACHLFPARMPDNFIKGLSDFLYQQTMEEQKEARYAAR
ncbi:MAG: alpha/beta hydrolase [Desulfobacteraceae bacterium]|nr:alpha/beta hydrolase [Desulfobacteraceae bacterium]